MFAFPLAAVLLGAIPSLTSATSLGFESAKGYAQCARALTQRSCHSSYSIPADSAGTCCYNGALQMGGKESGLALQTQFWDTAPSTGPADSWTIHGLWPDNCDGTYQQYCTNITGIPEYFNVSQIIGQNDPALLEAMSKYWKDISGDDESFWEHEYNKHGTCFSTLRPECQPPFARPTKAEYALIGFFRETVKLFRSLPTYDWLSEAGIEPSSTKNYTRAEITSVLAKKHGGIPYLGCTGKGKNKLDEVWYFNNIYGPVAGGLYVPVDSTTNSSCPETGIQYLPKYANATQSQ